MGITMRTFLTLFLLCPLLASGAVPSFTSFLGTNNIYARSNTTTGKIQFLDKTNHTFISRTGYDYKLGWFINDAGGDVDGTGTNYGFFDHNQDALSFYTWGGTLDWYFGNDLWVPNMDGNGTVVVNTGVAAGGKLQTTNSLNVSNINTASFFTTNGIQGNWPDTQVFWSSNGWLATEAAFTYDRSEDILSVNQVTANYLFSYQSSFLMPTITAVGANSNQVVWADRTNTVDMLVSTNLTFTNFNTIPSGGLNGISATYLAFMKVTNAAGNIGVNWGIGSGYGVRIFTNANNTIWTTLTNTKTYVASWTFRGTNGHLRLSLEE